MKILTFKRLVGLAVIGGVAYAHKQRGGDWTLDSIKGTLRHLWSSANDKLAPVGEELRESLHRAAHVSETATRSGMPAEPRSSYGFQKRSDDDNNRH